MELERSKQEYLLWVKDYLGNLCNCPPNSIGNHTPFFELGVSSLDMVQFSKDFSDWSGLNIDVSDLFNYPNVEKFVYYVTHINELKIEVQNNIGINPEPIAVIGLACSFPGSPTAEEYWSLMENGMSAVSVLGQERFSHGFNFPVFAGLVENIDQFDYEHFGLSKEEAKNIDPQQKILMTLSWEALENAGYAPLRLKNSNTGVFIGLSTHDYALEKASKHAKVSIFDGTGGAHSIGANRISYYYDFLGPSLAVDTACSSSLLSIHLACNSLKMNECDMALAGGVNAILSPILTESFFKAGMLSPTGTCKTFSEGADGYVRSEGGGMIVLKKYSKAIADGDKILALVKGSAVNQDGKTNTITAPNGLAQERVVRQAQASAQLKASDIHFIEAHGTGTPLGDPIEYKALNNVFKGNSSPVFLSSVKTNIGHLEAGAGIAGSIKAILSLRKKCFPKLINFKKLNTNIASESSSLKIATENITWVAGQEKKRIGVSSFGFGGTNVHLIFEEYIEQKALEKMAIEESFSQYLCFFSSTSEGALKETLKKYEEYLGKNPKLKLDEIAYSLLTTRSNLSSSHYFIADSIEDFRKKISQSLEKKPKNAASFSSLALAFTGQGCQYPKMGMELYTYFPVFRDHFNYILKKFKAHFSEDLFFIWKENPQNKLFRTDYGQALLFAYEYSLYKLLESVGVYPLYVFGHSLGEIVATICAEYLSLDDGIKLIAARGKAMQKSPSGRMLSVEASEDVIQKILGNVFNEIDIATKNTAYSIVLSGEDKAIHEAQNLLKAQSIACTMLKVEQGFHSRLMKPVIAEFEEAIKEIQYIKPKFKLLSCSLAKILEPSDLSPQYWGEHLLYLTDFVSVSNLIDRLEVKAIIEVGPHMVLGHFLKNNLMNNSSVLASAFRNQGEFETFWTLLANLYMNEYEIRWEEIFSKRGLDKVTLPNTKLNCNSIMADRSFHDKVLDFSSVLKLREELKLILESQLEIKEKDKKTFDFSQPIINMGADSLTLLNFIESTNELFKVNIRVNDIFDKNRTLETLADFIYGQLDRKEKDQKEGAKESQILAKSNIHYNIPSQVQEACEVGKSQDLMKKMSAQDVMAVEFSGNLTLDSLKETLKWTMQSHDAFYAKYDLELKALAFTHNGYSKVSTLDFSLISNPKNAYLEWENKRNTYVLDISKEPLSMTLIKLSESHYRLHIIYHRGAFNRQAMSIFVEDVVKNYYLTKKDLPLVNRHYETYIKSLSSVSLTKRTLKVRTHYAARRVSKIFSIKKMESDFLNDKNYSGSFAAILIEQIVTGLEKILKQRIQRIGVCVSKDIVGNTSELFELSLNSLENNLIHETLVKTLKNVSSENNDFDIVINLNSFYRLPVSKDLNVHFCESEIQSSPYPLAFHFQMNNTELFMEIDYQTHFLTEYNVNEFLLEFLNIK